MRSIINIYVDGSFVNGNAHWAFVVEDNGTALHSARGVLSGDINNMRQVGGELKSVVEAVRYAAYNSAKARIFYDYTGIYFWVADYFGGKPWKTNNKWTKKYREIISQNLGSIEGYVKVKAHSGNPFNELVDKLAKGN